jgi:Ca2+-binding EF-hand superfamily protein
MGLHGMRLHELFNMMDTSGDGVVDRAELMTALVAVTAPGPGPEARFVMQRHARALAEAEDARRAKRAADRAFKQRMRAAEASGVVAAFERLDAFMRKWQMKCADLWRLNDLDGDGNIDARELHAILAVKCQAPFTRAQVEQLVAFLDTDGSGALGDAELQAAVDDYRRYRRAKLAVLASHSRAHGRPLLTKEQTVLLLQYLTMFDDGGDDGAGGAAPAAALTPTGGAAAFSPSSTGAHFDALADAGSLSVSELQRAIDQARGIPLSQYFRELRSVLHHRHYANMDEMAGRQGHTW